MPKREESIETRFSQKVQRAAPGACWEWQGSIANTGYGQMSVRRPDGRWTMENTHRIAWKLAHGAIPADQCVLHRCDNRKCVNPAHLFLGTKADNIADMVSKGRQARGEKKPGAKLTAAVVRQMREMVKSGRTMKQVGRAIGVSASSVCMIASGKRWGHVA